jgi:hypothetical protein
MTWVWDQDIKSSDKLVLLALADHADHDGVCWPGMRRIAEKCSVSKRTVINSLNRLIDKQLIMKKHRVNDSGSNQSNYYYLAIPPSENITPPSEGDALLLVMEMHEGGEGNEPPPGEGDSPKSSIKNHQRKHQFKTSKKTKANGSLCNSEEFEQFWDTYPKKKNKGQARKAWLKLSPDKPLIEKIHQSLEVAKENDDWQKDNGKYIPYPATWLNAEGWEDDQGGDDSDLFGGAL